MSGYALNNAHAAAAAHHRALSELFDVTSSERVDELCDINGGTVAELGAGHGAFALWLAQRVGPDGHVFAADIDPTKVPHHFRLSTVQQDLTQTQWDPDLDGPFDLVHARLTLAHLPAREAVLSRMVQRVTPGGWVLVEDWSVLAATGIVAAPTDADARLWARYQMVTAGLFADSGTDPEWAKRIHKTLLADDRIGDVSTRIVGGYWTGGDPGCRLLAATLPQLKPRLMAAGFTVDELQQINNLLHDHRFVMVGHPLYSTAGQRIG